MRILQFSYLQKIDPNMYLFVGLVEVVSFSLLALKKKWVNTVLFLFIKYSL